MADVFEKDDPIITTVTPDDFRLSLSYQLQILEQLQLMNRILMEALDLEDME